MKRGSKLQNRIVATLSSPSPHTERHPRGRFSLGSFSSQLSIAKFSEESWMDKCQDTVVYTYICSGSEFVADENLSV